MFRMLHNYSGHRYAYVNVFATLILIYCGSRDSGAGLPINILRPRPDPNITSSSSTPPLNHLKVSVQTTTDQFGDETIMDKEEL
jgi:hypothetical protein